jgi:hypothetical protein
VAYHRIILGGVVAAAAHALPISPAAASTVGERVILDGCEVGGGGNDIHSLQSHYDPKRDEIVVILRLCSAARPKATYRVYLDHTAPFVGKAAASATCATMADSVVAQTPDGHQGVGASRVQGNTVRFVVPLAKLHVGNPKDVPLIPMWATSTLGKVEDRAPNRETGDGCEHPRAATETLVQARVAVTGITFILGYSFTGAIASTPGQAIALADLLCQQDAKTAGLTNTANIHAWLSNEAGTPASYVNPFFGPIQTADGTQVAQSTSAFSSCTLSGNTCLQAPIDKDIHGNPVLQKAGDDPFVWTGTYPAGDDGGGALPNCRDWTSDSASDIGGNMIETNAGFTTGGQESCDKTHHVMCVQFQ